MMIEDFCIQKTSGVTGVIGSLENTMVEETASGWFDGAVLLDFFAEIIRRHKNEFPERDKGDIKMKFLQMTERNPNRSDEIGALVTIQVNDKTYAVCPVRRGD